MTAIETTQDQVMFSINPYVLGIRSNLTTSNDHKFSSETHFSNNSKGNYTLLFINFTNVSNTLNNSGSLFLIEENQKKISQLRSLLHNWNGYGAKPFSTILLDKIETLLPNLTVQPKIFPTGRESIQFEFEKTNGDYLEFEIFEDSINYLLIRDGIEIEETLKESEINKLIKDFNA
jgi:hypothetical protein